MACARVCGLGQLGTSRSPETSASSDKSLLASDGGITTRQGGLTLFKDMRPCCSVWAKHPEALMPVVDIQELPLLFSLSPSPSPYWTFLLLVPWLYLCFSLLSRAGPSESNIRAGRGRQTVKEQRSKQSTSTRS